jgi:hypothetical protein
VSKLLTLEPTSRRVWRYSIKKCLMAVPLQQPTITAEKKKRDEYQKTAKSDEGHRSQMDACPETFRMKR